MRIVFDIEANRLVNPDKVWVIACSDIDTGEEHVFRNITDDEEERQRFISFARQVDYWIGHNILDYDIPVLTRLLGIDIPYGIERICDTLVCSKLYNYPRQGHSIESYGLEFGLEKEKYKDYSQYSLELERRCIRDKDINLKVYHKYKDLILKDIRDLSPLDLEQRFTLITKGLSDKGFRFNIDKAKGLLDKVTNELMVLDKDILETYVPKLHMVRMVEPKVTKHGTLSKTDFRFLGPNPDLSEYNGGSFCRCSWVSFNPASHKQIIRVLSDARWKPVDKTQGHIDTEREINRLKYKKVDKTTLHMLEEKLTSLRQTGWKVNENNLETLPPSAPSSAKLLAKRILLESRRRTLSEWIALTGEDSRIHGKFYGIGAWTHRMAHQQPNTANIPNELDTAGKKKLLGKELRSLWCAPRNRLLVGVDAEGIQLRIFAHYIDDPEFTEALVNGKKEQKTDPHSLNQSILGSVCKSRAAAKRYIYALLLGAGNGKLREILDCNDQDAAAAYERLLGRYQGFARLKSTIIPRDAKRGWFVGLDGRRVIIPGDTEGQRKHLAMSGYLQNGEAIVMKRATLRFSSDLPESCFLVNFVHDEWQTETPNNMEIALRVASLQADSLRIVGEDLKLKCPLAGSYWNDDLKDYTIDKNWSRTH